MHLRTGLSIGPTYRGKHLLPYNLTLLVVSLFTFANDVVYFMCENSDKLRFRVKYRVSAGVSKVRVSSVSYTHLTLPTILRV